MDFQVASNIIQNIAVIVASVIAIYGINSWRREIKWKKKYELIEDTLVLFYEADEKLKIIRHPASWGNEGNTRKKMLDERPEETERPNRDYVLYERWEREKETFIKLQSIKFRFIAVFGKEFIKTFDEVRIIVNEIFLAHNRLNDKYWREQGKRAFTEEEFQEHLKQMHNAEEKIWDSFEETDKIRIRMKNTIEQIESLYDRILGKKYNK